MKIIAMVPARQGSKGLPDKNITNLLGKPLISYSILSTLKCEKINSVYINSDSDKYLEIGEKLGAKRYKRSKKLAKDQTSMKDVLIDFSKFLIDNQIDFDVPLEMSFESVNEFRANIGIRFNLTVIAFQANHTFSKYPVTTLGVGVSLR